MTLQDPSGHAAIVTGCTSKMLNGQLIRLDGVI